MGEPLAAGRPRGRHRAAGRAPAARGRRRRPRRARHRSGRRPRPVSPNGWATRCSPTRCRAPATGPPRSPPMTCCCATRRSPRGRARAGDPRRRPADVQAAARLAGVARRGSTRSRLTPRRAWQDPAAVVSEVDPATRRRPCERGALRQRRIRTGLPAGAAPTTLRPPRSSRALGDELSEPLRGAPARRMAGSGGDSVRGRPRCRSATSSCTSRPAVKLPRGALQPRRQRDRRDRLDARSAWPPRAQARWCC